MSVWCSANRLQKRHIPFFICAALCLAPAISSPIALLIGFALACVGLVPESIDTAKLTKELLAYSIVGLGFGINVEQAISVSQNNTGLIVTSIFSTLCIGWVLTKVSGIEQKTGHLIASGTAICGGSAIAAVAPAINASTNQTSIALATVFTLNSLALFVFPAVGHALNMSQEAFGLWSAIAIHDTSSVVGAASAYGEESLVIATTLKLARALWIVPVAFISSLLFEGDKKKIAVPFFILFYCAAILVAHILPSFQPIYDGVFELSKRVMVVCLFLVGSSITFRSITNAGPKPLLLGLTLWALISGASLIYIQRFMGA